MERLRDLDGTMNPPVSAARIPRDMLPVVPNPPAHASVTGTDDEARQPSVNLNFGKKHALRLGDSARGGIFPAICREETN